MLRKKGQVVLEELELPTLASGDILVKMKVCGLCGTDIEKIQGQYNAAKPVLGHEVTGVVTDVGKDVDEVKVGDRVFPHHHTSCHSCLLCRKGSVTMCSHYRASNIDPGGFSEYFRVPFWNIQQGGVLKFTENISFEEASFIEPIGCCLRCISKCSVSKLDSVLVIGAGPMGLIHLQLLKQIGAKVLVSDINKKRLGLAKDMGAFATYDVCRVDVASKIRDETDGLGVDVALVAAGSPGAIVQALRSVRKGGRVSLFGVPVMGSILDYDFSKVFNSEISIISSYGATEVETKDALQLIKEKKLNVESLITHRFTLDEFEEAITVASKGNGLKILITS